MFYFSDLYVSHIKCNILGCVFSSIEHEFYFSCRYKADMELKDLFHLLIKKAYELR